MSFLNIRELVERANKTDSAIDSMKKYFIAAISSDVESRVAEMKETDSWNYPDSAYNLVRRDICREWAKKVEKASRIFKVRKEVILAEIDASMRYRFSA